MKQRRLNKMRTPILHVVITILLTCWTPGLNGEDDCGGYINATDVDWTLTSPGYPNNYRNNMDCVYHLVAPEGQRVYLTTSTIDGFRMEKSEFCEKDYILVIDGPSENGPIITRACNAAIAVLSNGRHLTILFHSDGDTTDRGFRLLFRAISETESCPKQYFDAFKNNHAFTSPFYPMKYPNNMECDWRITAPQGYVVYLEVERSSLEQSEQCGNDYVRVYDAAYKGAGFTLGEWCGSELPSPIHSSGIFMTIVFHSNDQISDAGFRLVYSVRPKSDFPDTPENNTLPVISVVVAVVLVVVVLVAMMAVYCVRRSRSRNVEVW